MATGKEKATTVSNSPLKKQRHRSPNYPAIGLEKALERTEALQAQARHHFVPVTAAYNIWGYKQSTGNQTIAALKSFGLVEVQGEKQKRELRLTDEAHRILGNAPNRPMLLRNAALKPDIHKEIWDKYEGVLPADSVIRNYLIWDRKFNKDVVDGFIAQLKETIEFANVKISGTIRSDDGDDRDTNDDAEDDDDDGDSEINLDKGSHRFMKNLQQARLAGQRAFPVYLTKHQTGILQVPEEMTKKDYELLKQQIENHLAIILVTSVIGDNGDS